MDEISSSRRAFSAVSPLKTWKEVAHLSRKQAAFS
jgi:hypothetical protein